MPDDPSAPQPTPTNYQRTTGGSHLRWVPPTPEHLQEMLPAYEILSILGQGGMGAVYKGRQKSLDRIVAIKILPPEAGEDGMQFVERFKNEARTMAKMNHPAIVHVYDFGETTEGQLYIVMEFIDGTDVAKMIQEKKKLPEDYALAITAHMCDALGYAHTHGVIHRDIKPANILINMEGQVKVADFGLAKATDASQMGLTKTNMAMGTPDFVSPEALMPGVPLDGRADLYAVGVMLFNMLTGTIPRGAFRMPSITHQTDARFDKIIGKAMEMDRELRYQTALDLRRDLDVILTTPLAKPGGRTISVKPRDLPQKPVGKSPSAPQQQRAPGSTGVAVRAGQAPPSGSAAKPGAPPAKTGQNAQTPAALKKESNAGMIYGIAAAIVVIAVAIFLFAGGGKKPAPAPKAVAEAKPETKKPETKPTTPKISAPAASTPLSGTFTLDVKDAELSGGEANFQREAFQDHHIVKAWFPGSNEAKPSVLTWKDVRVAAGKYDITFIAGGKELREFEMQLNVGKGRLSVLKFRPENGSVNATQDFPVGSLDLSSTAEGVNLVCTKWSLAKKSMSKPFHLRGIRFAPASSSASVAASPPLSDEVLIFGGHRYQLLHTQMTWAAAKTKAEAMGGHLVTVTTTAEADFVRDKFLPQVVGLTTNVGARRLMLGGQRANASSPWEWVTGEPFDPSLWVGTRSDPKGTEPRYLSWDYGIKRWEHSSARVEYFPLIEWDDAGAAKSAPVATSSAKSGDVLTFGGHRYQHVKQIKVTWDAAKAEAARMGGHLATITSQAEHDFIAASLKDQLPSGYHLFVGLSREADAKDWRWVTGEPFAFSAWTSKNPDATMKSAAVGAYWRTGSAAKMQVVGWDDLEGMDKTASGFLIEWDDDGSKPAPVAASSSLTAPVNLLALVDVKRDAVKGTWELKPEGLVLTNIGGSQVLEINTAPPEEYDFEMEFTLSGGIREVSQLLAVPGGNILWKMGHGGGGTTTVFSFGPLLDGKKPDDKSRTEALVRHDRLKSGHRYRSLVEVRQNSLRALLDGEEVLKWTGDLKRLGNESGFNPLNSAHLGLAAYDTGVLFHMAELRPAAAQPAQVATPAAASMKPAPAMPAPPADPRLAQLEAGYQARYESDAQKPFLAAVATLNQSYVANGISRARAAAQAKGSLAEVTALDAEKAAIEKGSGVPAEDAEGTPESLKALRGTYRTAYAKLVTDRAAKAAPLLDLYLKALDVYIAELTKAGKIDEAKQVQALRDTKAAQK